MNRTVAVTAGVALVVGATIGHLATRMYLCPDEHTTEEEGVIPPTLAFAQTVPVTIIDCEDASLEEVIDYLRSYGRTGIAVPGEPPPYRLNFVLIDPDHVGRPLNLRMRDVRLDQLCRRVAQEAGVTVSFEEDAIVFEAPTKPNNKGCSGVEERDLRLHP